MLISGCLIVRNEEERLPAVVGSLSTLCDEVVVGDTKSTDHSIQCSIGLGCKVIGGLDRMNKARARNATIDAASGDWIVIIDADEVIVSDGKEIRTFLERTSAGALYVNLNTYNVDKETLVFSNSQVRIFKRGLMRYKYRAHEIPIPVDGDVKAIMTGFLYNHYPTHRHTEPHRAYTMDRLKLDVEENPGDPRPLFYLGRQQLYGKEYKSAIINLKRYISLGGGADIDGAWYSLAECYRNLGDHRNEIAVLHQCCAVSPSRRVYWGTLAMAYWNNGNPRVAIGLMEMVTEMPVPVLGKIQRDWYSDKPNVILSNWKRQSGIGEYEVYDN